jgi:hypothetical protein
MAKNFRETTGIVLTDAQMDRLTDFNQRWLDKYLVVEKVDVRYYLGSGTVEAGERLQSTGARASVVSLDPMASGHDVAVMKADLTGVPALPLASGSPNPDDATYVVGYPRQGFLEEEVPVNATVKATLAVGKARSKREMDGGWSAYGTDAAVTHGNSGGPVLDARGRVAGIVSFSEVDDQGRQVEPGGFFVPAEIIKSDLQKASVKLPDNAKGLTPTYYRALAEGDVQRYKTELVLLSDVRSWSPWHAYVKDDVSKAESAVMAGQDRTPPDLEPLVPIGAGAAALAIVAAAAAWIALAARRRRQSPRPGLEPELEAADAETPHLQIEV